MSHVGRGGLIVTSGQTSGEPLCLGLKEAKPSWGSSLRGIGTLHEPLTLGRGWHFGDSSVLSLVVKLLSLPVS